MKTENFSKTKIKICGLRRREDILAVNEAKPDYCGFIIEFPSSFRSVTADEVRELVKELDPEIRPVGVFVNAPMELVRTLLDDGTLALVQLHGQEDESYIRELKTYTDKLIIKAGAYAGKALDADGVKALASIPSKEVLLAQICGLLQSPISGLARVLAAVGEQKGGGAAAPAAAEEAAPAV